jgi:hypothetical protein
MTTHELDALRALHEQAVAEGQRLSAEVARLREELAGWRKGVEDANRISQRERATAERIAGALRGLLVGLGPGGYIPSAGEPATARARAALASLGSPQDERNTKKED